MCAKTLVTLQPYHLRGAFLKELQKKRGKYLVIHQLTTRVNNTAESYFSRRADLSGKTNGSSDARLTWRTGGEQLSNRNDNYPAWSGAQMLHRAGLDGAGPGYQNRPCILKKYATAETLLFRYYHLCGNYPQLEAH